MKLATAALLLLAHSTTTFSQSNDTTTWSILMGGIRKTGFVKRWKNPDGSFTEWRQFNDRGRGDSTIVTYSLDQRGFIVALNGGGVDYYKKPVSEKFKIVDGFARWENLDERKEKKIDNEAAFQPSDIRLYRNFNHYFNSPNQKINVIPSGESSLIVLTEHKLLDGKRVRLAAVNEGGYDPNYVWIDDNNDFFAYPGDYHAYIAKGYESQNFDLLKIQLQWTDIRYEALCKKLSEIPAGVVIRNASLFDSKNGTVKPNTTIVVENGIVREVTNKKNVRIPRNYKIIDAQGKFVMPGLWDNHIHYQDHSYGIMLVGCGITNARDMASGFVTLERKKAIDDGRAIGPRILLSGIIEGLSPFTAPSKAIASEDEGKKFIAEYAALGYGQIKLYSSLKPEWVKPLAAEAKRFNLRVSGHIPAHMLAEEAVRDGFDEITHINMLFLNFYGKELDTRTPARFVTVAQKAAFFEFEDPTWKTFLSLLKEHNTVIDPTVTNLESKLTGKAGEFSPTVASIANRLPESTQQSYRSGPTLQIPNGLEETYATSFINILKMIKQLHDNGITIIPGTDTYPTGFMLHRELENYVRAGIPNNEVLKMATWTSAQVNRKSDQYGTIEPNRPADIIIIDGDPLKNIQDLHNVEIVIKDKAVYQTKDLLEAVSIKSYK